MDSNVEPQKDIGRKVFVKNLNYLHKTHPSLAYQITLNDPKELEFCQTERGEPNLVRSWNNQLYYYHSKINALQEAVDWFHSLDLHAATVIIIYGIGLGYFYEAAKSWLKKHPLRRIVFLEQDPSVIHRLCETEIGSRIFKDPQVQLYLFKNLLNDKALINEISWSYFEFPALISSLKLYRDLNSEGFEEIRQQLFYEFQLKKDFIHEYLHCGIPFFRNFYPNLLELPKGYLGNGLFHQFTQIPAIICGAGPSLSKQLKLLANLSDRALIFAGGSALNALIPSGITPHFGVAIDPNIDQYKRVAIAQHHKIPFFYRGRLYHEALKAINGRRLYLTGAGGYETALYFEKEMNIVGEDLEEGHNVVNFSIQIAQSLGCSPIILIGVDLAFTGDRPYAQEISTNLMLNEKDLMASSKSSLGDILTKDIYNQPIHTLWKWIAEAKWISDFAEGHPNTTLINSTEGGLGFAGIQNLPLEEAVKIYLKKPINLLSSIDELIAKQSLSKISRKKIVKMMLKFKESLDACIHFLSKMEGEIDQEMQGKQAKNSSSIVLFETELEREVGYQYLLENFDEVFQHIHHREFKELTGKKNKSKKQAANRTLILQKERMNFLRDVAQVNRDLILHTLKN